METKHIALATVLFAAPVLAEPVRVYFGMQAGAGIHVAELDDETGELSAPRLAVKTKNAGFIAIHPNRRFLYSTGVEAFRINADGSLTSMGSVDSGGKGCCHVGIDATGQCLMAANYGSGGVASFRILEDGSLSEARSIHAHEGSGAHPVRQTQPHAHSIVPNPANTFAYAPDLGIDKVVVYTLDPAAGVLEPSGAAVVPGGAMGPRHMKWSTDGRIAYVLNELDLGVSLFRPGPAAGSLEFIRTVSVLPACADKENMTSAEIRIHPGGRFIYASTRDLSGQGRDSISVFSCFEDGFRLLETVPAQTRVPRNFNIDPSGKWMLVGGQKSGDVAIFRIDPATGHPEFTGRKVAIPGGPICIEFLANP
ncbi:MAG: lactonase family protein [Kiritimatiellales bacterium]|nr:lactonase family protein [Kiritimatiellales bacterium]MCF7863496.1 lactonase family protein [Kiritimatiellales bacterium]